MKIALLGYGKMGKAIENIAISRQHQIVSIVKDSTDFNLADADVAIDFSIPEAAYSNITSCFELGVPVISGTTGWLDKYKEVIALCNQKEGSFIYASNFSLGVNLFFELNKTLAKMMNQLESYKVDIEEIHHTQKLDAPSGTAITLAEGIINTHDSYQDWAIDGQNNKLPITAKRIEKVPGTHTVTYNSTVDSISINHTAHNREGFALGAVVAAEWLVGKKGVFSMQDVLNIG
ncbi:MAG: 4-hydroxy-tetrahydrodipicolinate reductase [Bacteroidetes bacterium MedPE-SWsnd-G2]|nr:MAG: 4-hydroxy-tetrahydrodipicolinate reductase [Bacteroidetes bacterium MedPE-SWsnd-G2]